MLEVCTNASPKGMGWALPVNISKVLKTVCFKPSAQVKSYFTGLAFMYIRIKPDTTFSNFTQAI